MWVTAPTAQNDDLRGNTNFLSKFDEVIEVALKDSERSFLGSNPNQMNRCGHGRGRDW